MRSVQGHKESAANSQCEDRRDHSAQKKQRHVHTGHVVLDSDGPGKGRAARGELLW